MWWDGQNLDRPHAGPDGTRWFFRVWHGTIDGVHCQRLFFWDESQAETGLVELRGSETLHVGRIKQRLARLAKDADYRRRFARPLQFPLERYW